jgi:hypothetical protein
LIDLPAAALCDTGDSETDGAVRVQGAAVVVTLTVALVVPMLLTVKLYPFPVSVYVPPAPSTPSRYVYWLSAELPRWMLTWFW